MERKGAYLPQRVLGADRVGVVVHEKHAPLRAPSFLVGHRGEDDVAGELFLGGASGEHSHDDRAHRGHVLHVDGAATPDVAVLDQRLERRMRPRVVVGLDHVDVRIEKDRRFVASALQTRHHACPPRLRLVKARLDPNSAQIFGDPLRGRALMAIGRATRAAVHGRDANQVTKERDALVLGSRHLSRVHAVHGATIAETSPSTW